MKEKIVIFSAYNRALWLALELRSKGYDIFYIDFSARLGGLSPDAWESPFGIFQIKKINYSQNVFLSEGAALKKVNAGFTILSEKGPIEFQGPLRKQSFQRYFIDRDQLDYLKTSSSMGEDAFIKFKSLFKKMSFEKTWCLHLTHQLASQTYFDDAHALDQKGRPLPILENWMLRTISRRGAHEIFQTTSSKGVQVFECKIAHKIKQEKGKIQAIAITDQLGKKSEISGDLFLNFLSQEEFFSVSTQLFTQVISEKPIVAQWFWTRYRFFTNQNEVTRVLPEAFLLIADRFLPWTHENALMIHRGPRSHEFVIWCRVPGHYRFQESRLQLLGEKIRSVFTNHFLETSVLQIEMPLECLATEFSVQAPQFPVFSQQDLGKIKKSAIANLMSCGPEEWKRLDTTYLLTYQQEILDKLMGAHEEPGIKKRRGRDQEIYS